MKRVEGKVVLITGAARGQGRSHAVKFAEEGADVIAIDICRAVETVPYEAATPDDLAETVRQVEGLGRRIVATETDIRDLDALRDAVDKGVAQLGRLDIVLANAGISTYGSALEMTEEQWDTMIEINLTGAWKTVKVAAPHIIAGGRGGSIVITSSVASLLPYENVGHYAAAKAGLVSLMKCLAKELGHSNIRVNTVHPSSVDTIMSLNEPTYQLFRPELEDPTYDDIKDMVQATNALPFAMLESIDITNAILYLVSDDARYITGTTHFVDGGRAVY